MDVTVKRLKFRTIMVVLITSFALIPAATTDDEDEGEWVQVPFSGSITIQKVFQGSAEMKGEEKDSGISTWTGSCNGQLRATITHSSEIRDSEGQIIGYQPVGYVSGHIRERETLRGGGYSAVSIYTASDRKQHPSRPNRRDGWCSLSVNPKLKRYRLTLPSISLGKGSGTTTITIVEKDFSWSGTEPFEGLEPKISWDSSYGPERDKMQYSPSSGSVTGSHAYHTAEYPASVRRAAQDIENPQFAEIAAAATELERMRREAKGRAPRIWDGSYRANWNLQIGKAKARVVLEPAGEYAEWIPQLPQGTGNMIEVKARIAEPAGMAGRFEFKLEDVGQEPGICMNEPASDADDTQDLTIAPIGSGLVFGGDGQSAKTESAETEASVFVQSRDWGAYGKLTATAKLVLGGEEVEVTAVFEKTGEPFLTIPMDDNSNSVADAWEKQMGITSAAGDADEDDTPISSTKGDGLSVYEEYRGFFVKGSHHRTDPRKKDLFLHDPDDLAQGSPLERATGLTIHYVDAREMHIDMTPERVVNFNNDRHHLVDQHGIWVHKGPAPDGTFGQAGPNRLQEPNGPPRTCDPWVVIDVDRMRRSLTGYVERNRDALADALKPHGVVPDDAWLESQITELVRWITAHETCHCLSVDHHPGLSDGRRECIMRYPKDSDVYGGSELWSILSRATMWPFMLCGRPGNNCKNQVTVSDREN